MSELSITFIGDLTIDTYPELGKVHLGGASMNSAVWAHRAGVRDVSIAAAAGDDGFGKAYLAKMEKEGIDTAVVSVIPGNTSHIEIFIDKKSGDRRWGKWNAGVLENYHLGKNEFRNFQTKRAVSLTVYGKTVHLLKELVSWGKEQHQKPFLCVDFDDLSQFHSSTKIVRDYINGIDAGFFGLDPNVHKNIIQELQMLAGKTGKLLVITTGSRGSLAFQGNKEFFAPVRNVKDVVDTTGAGDAFLAGFISHYMKSCDILSSLKAGNRLAARKIQLLGAY